MRHSALAPPKLPLSIKERLSLYIQLTRLDRPIGIYLLLWPTMWSLWLAAGGIPSLKVLIIFICGVVLMRSAGCVINDYADRNFDGYVERTKDRPLASGKVSTREAVALFITLCTAAFILVLMTNRLTIILSIGGVLLAAAYPFMKRFTFLPQVVLGAAFAWSVPMAYAAQTGEIPQQVWLIYTATVVWTVVYDTMYAMVDKEDDLKIGIKSSAILFGQADKFIIAVLQLSTLAILIMLGRQEDLGVLYYLGLVIATMLFVYQQHLIRYREPEKCFKAFLNNHWVGAVIFLGLYIDLALKLSH